MAKDSPLELIAYKGEKLTIEWYFDVAGHSQALEYAESMDDSERKKLAALLLALGDIGQLRNKEKFRYESDKFMPSNQSRIDFWRSSFREPR